MDVADVRGDKTQACAAAQVLATPAVRWRLAAGTDAYVSINQSINQSMNQWINPSINQQSTNQSTKQSVSQLINQLTVTECSITTTIHTQIHNRLRPWHTYIRAMLKLHQKNLKDFRNADKLMPHLDAACHCQVQHVGTPGCGNRTCPIS